MLFMMMAFCSGLFAPLTILPAIIQKTAFIWPAYHMQQLTLAAAGLVEPQSLNSYILALVGVAFVAFAIASRRLARVG
jgi:ABC-2 type transport system permease protein